MVVDQGQVVGRGCALLVHSSHVISARAVVVVVASSYGFEACRISLHVILLLLVVSDAELAGCSPVVAVNLSHLTLPASVGSREVVRHHGSTKALEVDVEALALHYATLSRDLLLCDGGCEHVCVASPLADRIRARGVLGHLGEVRLDTLLDLITLHNEHEVRGQ